MATAHYLLVFCVLAWVHCMAQLDAKSLDALNYTDCLPDTHSKLNISAITLSIYTLSGSNQIYLSLRTSNPAIPGTPTKDVADIYWTLNFPNPITGNQSVYGSRSCWGTDCNWQFISSISLNQTISSGWLPFQLVFYSLYSELACWEGRVYVTAPPNPSNCGGDLFNLSSVSLHADVFNQSSSLTFKVENTATTRASFNKIQWTILYSSDYRFYYYQEFNSPVALEPRASIDLSTTDVQFTSTVNISWYQYYSYFYYNAYNLACWTGYQVLQPSPPNPPGCSNGNSLLSVKNVVLNPSSPQIHDSIYLTFEVENWSKVSVTFNNIYSKLTFNPSSLIAYNLTLPDLTLRAGQSISLVGNKATLNQSVSLGTYPYEFVFYSNSTTKVGCWRGNVNIRNRGDCLDGPSQLKVTDVILIPNSPQIYDPVNLIFTVENESGRNVAFNGIYWTLTFTPGKPVRRDLTLGGYVSLTNGTSLALNGKSFTLNESISAGKYPYQIEIYEDTTKIACWEGEIVVSSLSPSLKTSKTEDP